MANYKKVAPSKRKKTGKKPHKDKLPVQKVSHTVASLKEDVEEWKEKAFEFIENTDFDLSVVNTSTYIQGNLFKPVPYAEEQRRSVSYRTAEELMEYFNAFSDVMVKLSEKSKFTPTINTFCNFAGISRNRFMGWSNENNERGEVCAYIRQQLEENYCQGMLNGNIKETSGVFIAKAMFNMRDGDNPQVNIMNVNTEKSVEDIMEEFSKHLTLTNSN